MACPRVALEEPQIADDPRAEWVEMEVAHQLHEVRLRLDHDGLVPVLEEVAHPLVAAIEGPPHGGVSQDRMLLATGRLPVRTKRWAWVGTKAQT